MLIYPVEFNGTTSLGTFSQNTVRFSSAILKQIIIEATTSTATFRFKITDDKDLTVFDTETHPTGKLREEVNIPLKGIYTLAVLSASINEAYSGRLLIKE